MNNIILEKATEMDDGSLIKLFIASLEGHLLRRTYRSHKSFV